LKIIRDEAFRCKEITQKLLSLARGSGDAMSPVSLAVVAEEVAGLIRGLNRYSDRRLIVDMEDSLQLTVMGSVTEIKQVLLNLTINALEATPPGTGEVCIIGRRNEGMVEISVKDNGKGMSRNTPLTLQVIFGIGDFFTLRRFLCFLPFKDPVSSCPCQFRIES